MATFDEIHDAFFFVSSDTYGMNRALLCLDDGKIYFQSEIGEINELDEEEFDCDRFIEIPHKNDLNLGSNLALEYAVQNLPDDLALVDGIFRSRGACSRFKDLLEHRGLLQSWYDFQSHREEEALRQWALENDIELKST